MIRTSYPCGCRRALRTVGFAACSIAVFSLMETPQRTKAEDAKLDRSVKSPVAWLLAPLPVQGADAKTEAEMKPYKEAIPGSEAAFEMLPIPGGKFLLGSAENEGGREASEGPQVEVEVAPFWMGKCEVTWEEFELWAMGMDQQRRQILKQQASQHDELADTITMPTKPYTDMTFGMGRDGFPAICMTQLAAKMYCKWLSAKTGRYYRLPTEAEWEYACRAGTRTAYSFGDDDTSLEDHGWYFDNSDDAYHKVGQKKPNPWGLHDMHGNVAEWVLDQFSEDGYADLGTPPLQNPLRLPTAVYPRTVRGGSWFDDPEQCRSAARHSSDPSWKQQDPQIPQSVWYYTDADFVGFRVVRPLQTPTEEEAQRYDLDEVQRQNMLDYMEIKGISS